MKRQIQVFWTAATLTALCMASAASLPAQEVPKEITAPASAREVLRVHAKGDQIYVCREDNGKFAWTLRAPEAQLFNKDGEVVGRHFAGPTWESKDGSRVAGKTAANVPAPDADAIPWLLVNVVNHEGNGVLSSVTVIQRIHTKGGKAPVTGCDHEHAGQETRAAYEADYVFWATR